MRCIRKSAEPVLLRTWRGDIRPRGTIPPWTQFPEAPRAIVRTTLSEDQDQLCCYCCATIARGNFHIEHFRPRRTFRDRTYQWKNMLASCQTSKRKFIDGVIVETQRHCGDAKDNWFETGVTIDPLFTQVESFFRYRLDGWIFPSKRQKARYAAIDETITRLNLNAPSLVRRRAVLLATAGADVGTMTRAQWQARYLDVQPDGSRQEFLPALQYNYHLHWSQKWP